MSPRPETSVTEPPAAEHPALGVTEQGPASTTGLLLGVGISVAALTLGLVLRGGTGALVADNPALGAWITIFVAIALQAFPFLVLGVVLAAVVAVLLPMDAVTRLLPRNRAASVPAAGLAGALLPGCECASVPLAQSLMSRGMPSGAALTFLLSAPAINPIVLVATAVAFNGDWHVVLARFLASLLTSVLMGWWWLKWGRDDLIQVPRAVLHEGTAVQRFAASVSHDILHAGGYLVLGGALSATVSVLVPPAVLDALGGQWLLSVLVLAIFAVVVAVCSEADAFIAASLPAVPMTARLAFMVVGPALDLKLFAMQVGTFGRPFATRFAPMTFVVAVLSAVLVGSVLL